jgi:hypothetical protein
MRSRCKLRLFSVHRCNIYPATMVGMMDRRLMFYHLTKHTTENGGTAVSTSSRLTFFLDKKSNKKVKEKRMLRFFSGPTHRYSEYFIIVYWFRRDSAKLRCLLCGASKGAVFRLDFFIAVIFLRVWRNNALVEVECSGILILSAHRCKGWTTD